MSITHEDRGSIGVRADARWFYVWTAIVCVLFAFFGFAPTYWLPLATGALTVNPVVHLHGAVFFSWTLFLVLQTSLVANGRTAKHRQTGMIGVALAGLMLITGVMVTAHSLAGATAAGFALEGRIFSIVPLTGVVFFAILVGFAIANVRHPDVHKRLMLIATVSILEAPVARWFLVAMAPADAVGPPPVTITVMPAIVVNLLLIAIIVWDWKLRGRVHRAYVYGFGAFLALQVLRIPLSESSAWLSFATWFGTVTS
jgi:hypothetical protein